MKAVPVIPGVVYRVTVGGAGGTELLVLAKDPSGAIIRVIELVHGL